MGELITLPDLITVKRKGAKEGNGGTEKEKQGWRERVRQRERKDRNRK